MEVYIRASRCVNLNMGLPRRLQQHDPPQQSLQDHKAAHSRSGHLRRRGQRLPTQTSVSEPQSRWDSTQSSCSERTGYQNRPATSKCLVWYQLRLFPSSTCVLFDTELRPAHAQQHWSATTSVTAFSVSEQHTLWILTRAGAKCARISTSLSHEVSQCQKFNVAHVPNPKHANTHRGGRQLDKLDLSDNHPPPLRVHLKTIGGGWAVTTEEVCLLTDDSLLSSFKLL